MSFPSGCHTHSTHCDGKHSLMEMLTAARDLGFTSFGFSGHAAQGLDNGYSMTLQEQEKYFEEARTLRHLPGFPRAWAGLELDALAHEHQLTDDLRRSVMIFHLVQTDNERAYDLLQEITPMLDRDVLIDMDRHTVVLLKDTSDEDSPEELVQFAQALQETLMGETAHQMTVGIGRSRHMLAELRESYDEARRAIEVGRSFKPEESIYVYSRLILERFLMELPQDISAYYHSLLFNRKNQRLFNEEMLYTIDMFFKKDLNLSDTARQLYIHRNTLVYRLDKVQKQTGLDLRSFTDAVTFKILMELKKVGGERPSHRKN